jgi:heptosyltransferase-2
MGRKFLEWGGYWAPSFLIGILFALFAKRKRKKTSSAADSSILVMLIEHLGDIIVSTPLLRSLRTTLPTAKIIVVVSENGFPLIEHCPYVDKLIVAKSSKGWLGQLKRAFALAGELRSLDIDTAIVPKDAHNTDFNELVCILASCKRRISRARPQLAYRIKPLKFAPFYDHIIVDSAVRHEVEQRLEFARHMGGQGLSTALESWLTQEDLMYADRFIAENFHDNTPIIGFGIGASAAGRQWPLQSYADVIERLGKQLGASILLIVSPSEFDIARQVARLTNYPVHFSTTATVRHSTALLRRCSLFIGNDSGPMHMAASVGVPVIEISCHPEGASPWSISSPRRFGAHGVPQKVLQPTAMDPRCAESGCISKHTPHCITRILPDAVINAALQLLSSDCNVEEPAAKGEPVAISVPISANKVE